jgi:Leucine-rich repeat (LRR) protein
MFKTIGLYVKSVDKVYYYYRLSKVAKKIQEIVNEDLEKIWREVKKRLTKSDQCVFKIEKALEIKKWLKINSKEIQKIKKLNLAKKKMAMIPHEIGNFINIEKLNFSGNRIIYLPHVMINLKNLKELNLRLNEIGEFPEVIKYLKNLEVLNLSGNCIKKLGDDDLKNLKNLKNLDLSANFLEKLPNSIVELEKLEELFLQFNKLKNFPEEFGKLKNLIFFNFSGNQVKTLPESFRSLEALKRISCNRKQWGRIEKNCSKENFEFFISKLKNLQK